MSALRATAERLEQSTPRPIKKASSKAKPARKPAVKKPAKKAVSSRAAGKTAPKKAAPKKGTAKKGTAKKGTAKPASKAAAKSKTSVKSKTSAKSPLFLIDLAALRSRTRRRRLVLGSLMLLVGAFFAVALIQAQLVQTQSEVDRLQAEINRLENDLALLDREVVEASSPEIIVERATQDLGMVRALRPVYLVAARPLKP